METILLEYDECSQAISQKIRANEHSGRIWIPTFGGKTQHYVRAANKVMSAKGVIQEWPPWIIEKLLDKYSHSGIWE